MEKRHLIQRYGVWNKIPLEGGQIRHELAGEMVINWTIAIYQDDFLVISRNGEYKTIRVMKTQVKAAGGANGLFAYLDRACSKNSAAFEFIFLQGI